MLSTVSKLRSVLAEAAVEVGVRGMRNRHPYLRAALLSFHVKEGSMLTSYENQR